MPSESLTVAALDGHPLAADLHRPTGAPRGAVLVAPAMGVPRGYYAPFARHLAAAGFAALTVDPRGIGGSRPARLRGFPATLHGWGEVDLAGALAALAAACPGMPLLWVGHSAGGQLFGLLEDPPVAAALFVGAQSGHWRHWRGLARLGMAALWHLVIPSLVPVVGFLPMRAFRQGEDVPAGVALEWARWGRHREYILSHARTRPAAAFWRWPGRLRTYAMEDDGYAPPASVEALARGYAAARVEVRRVVPREIGVAGVGHFGFFRPQFERSLWAEALAFLGDAAREGSRAPPPGSARPAASRE